MGISLGYWLQITADLSAALLGLFPLYIGMIKKSTIATFVSSFVIAAIVSNSRFYPGSWRRNDATHIHCFADCRYLLYGRGGAFPVLEQTKREREKYAPMDFHLCRCIAHSQSWHTTNLLGEKTMIKEVNRACGKMNEKLGISVPLPNPKKKTLKVTSVCNFVVGAGLVTAGVMCSSKWYAILGGIGIISSVVLRQEGAAAGRL